MNRFSFQGDEEDNDENAEQDEDLFESAWQMLELCRIIYEKDTTLEGQKKLGDVIKTLGDVHLEDGNLKKKKSEIYIYMYNIIYFIYYINFYIICIYIVI